MPFYEYRCQNCAHELEALQKIADAPLVDCPQCGQPALKKLVSAAAFRLKGGGWYETDFKQDKKRNLHEGSAATETGEKKETKPADAKTPAPGGETKVADKPKAVAAD